MSMAGDLAREDEIQALCRKLAEKVKKYPEAATALKELGLEELNTLPRTPRWAHEYYDLFRPK